MSWFSDPLNDSRVEWSVEEVTSIIGTTEWRWSVAVDDKQQGHTAWTRMEGIHNARKAARRMLGNAVRIGKTRPCPLCGKPSLVGKATDTDECQRLLDIARAELRSLPDARL